MNGPQHYAEAERLIELASSPAGAAMKADGYDAATQAQVHATLALAAATAEGVSSPEFGPLVSYPRPAGVAFKSDPGYEGSPWGQVLA